MNPTAWLYKKNNDSIEFGGLSVKGIPISERPYNLYSAEEIIKALTIIDWRCAGGSQFEAAMELLIESLEGKRGFNWLKELDKGDPNTIYSVRELPEDIK